MKRIFFAVSYLALWVFSDILFTGLEKRMWVCSQHFIKVHSYKNVWKIFLCKSLICWPSLYKRHFEKDFYVWLYKSSTCRTIQRCFNRHSLIFLFKCLFSSFLQTHQSNAALVFFVNITHLYYCCRPFPSVCQRKVKVLFLSFLALPKQLLPLSKSVCRHSSVCQCPLCY